MALAPKPLDRNAVDTLVQFCAEVGLTPELLAKALGDNGLAGLNQANPAASSFALASRKTELTEQEFNLLELIVLREPANWDRWETFFGKPLTQKLRATGLLMPFDSDNLQSTIDIRPYVFPHLGGSSFIIASDPDQSLWQYDSSSVDLVPGVGNAARSLIRAIPAANCPWISAPQKILDLGCGSGVLSLALAAAFPQATVTGTDISQRALAFASVNDPGIDWRHGSWFNPVAGEKFDLIVSNPPFVVQAPVVEHTYRDSGLELDSATKLVITESINHLSPNGMAHILSSWAVTENDGVASLMNQWVPSHGAKITVHVREYASPEDYVATWLADESIDIRSADGRKKAADWLDYLKTKNVTHIALGFTHIQAINGPTEVTVETLPSHMTPGAQLGNDVAEWFLRTSWLDKQDEESLLDATYAVRPGVAIEKVTVADTESGQGFTPNARRLCRSDGPAWQHEIDEHVETILAGLNSEGLPLGEVTDLYAMVNNLDHAELRNAIVPITVDLIRHGFIIPSEILNIAAQ